MFHLCICVCLYVCMYVCKLVCIFMCIWLNKWTCIFTNILGIKICLDAMYTKHCLLQLFVEVISMDREWNMSPLILCSQLLLFFFFLYCHNYAETEKQLAYLFFTVLSSTVKLLHHMKWSNLWLIYPVPFYVKKFKRRMTFIQQEDTSNKHGFNGIDLANCVVLFWKVNITREYVVGSLERV